MDFETWISFTITYAVICLIPGPSVLIVIAQAISKGFRQGFLCILGDVVGGILVMTLSYVGVGAILAASQELFQIVKWLGVLYMVYLGISSIKEARSLTDSSLSNKPSGVESIRTGFFTGLFNPKAILFYVAFLTQFIDPAGDHLGQYIILGMTSSVVVVVVLCGYAFMATQAKSVFQSILARRRIGYASGALFFGGGLWIALTR